MDELMAMCNYSRNPSAPAPPSVSCYGTSGVNQNATFASGDYGFASSIYWSSSQAGATVARAQKLTTGELYNPFKSDSVNQRVRPIRAF